jgi:hypothetical protein
MARTRQIGNMTIHFVGDNAAQHERLFHEAYSGSESFRSALRETARTYRNIYVGRTLADLQDQPNYGDAGFNPNSKAVTDTAAFGKPAGAETYFIGVTGKDHTLLQCDQRFAGTPLLAMVHEFLHPSQITRELAETGGVGKYNEARTQMREQTMPQSLERRRDKIFLTLLAPALHMMFS